MYASFFFRFMLRAATANEERQVWKNIIVLFGFELIGQMLAPILGKLSFHSFCIYVAET